MCWGVLRGWVGGASKEGGVGGASRQSSFLQAASLSLHTTLLCFAQHFNSCLQLLLLLHCFERDECAHNTIRNGPFDFVLRALSNAHTLDECACAFKHGVQNVTEGRTDKAFLGVGDFE